MADKPIEFHLVNKVSAESLAKLYKNLTGRDATPEEIAAARRELGEADANESVADEGAGAS